MEGATDKRTPESPHRAHGHFNNLKAKIDDRHAISISAPTLARWTLREHSCTEVLKAVANRERFIRYKFDKTRCEKTSAAHSAHHVVCAAE
eukprot:6507089-Prymnesium_polylepis.1